MRKKKQKHLLKHLGTTKQELLRCCRTMLFQPSEKRRNYAKDWFDRTNFELAKDNWDRYHVYYEGIELVMFRIQDSHKPKDDAVNFDRCLLKDVEWIYDNKENGEIEYD